MIFANHSEYCLGFYFNKSREEVILVGKIKPPWQAGKMNGVGGKLELNKLGEKESPFAAMLREFEEETGIKTDHNVWRQKLIMQGRDWECWVFAGFHDSDKFPPFRNFKSDEEIALIIRLDHIKNEYADKVIPNLHWLIPLCLDDNVASAQATYY